MTKSSSIRHLENRAARNDIKALYELAEYYRQGKYVTQDKEKSKELIEKAISQFSQKSIHLKSIAINDFRGIGDLYINFQSNGKSPKNPIVIIGNNGFGKTTVLEAISKSLTWLTNRISKQKNTSGQKIENNEIRQKSQSEYASIVCQLSLDDKTTFVIELSRSKEGSDTNKKSDLEDITQLASLYSTSNNLLENFNLPIFSYYSVSRAVDFTRRSFQLNEEFNNNENSKLSGYKHSLNGATNFNDCLKWYKELDDYRNQLSFENNDISSIKEKLAVIESLLGKTDEVHNKNFLNEIRNKLNNVDDNIESSTKMVSIEHSITTINLAISLFLDGFTDLSVSREPTDFYVFKGNERLSLFQLSQGEKSALSLVLDICRRLILLNPGLDNPLEGHGIIMIDEIDLHIHPEWQQKIIPKLLEIFPNIQFIITTHSPHVLSTIKRENIIRLSKNEDGNIGAYQPQGTSYGENSAHVLEEIMHVKPRPNIPENQLYEEIDALIDSGEFESKRFFEKFEELKNKIGGQNSLVININKKIKRLKVLGK